MKTDDFDYSLPPQFIAQRPADPRDSSKLMALDRESGEIQHLTFTDLPQLLDSGDALVINETRVIPARLTAHKIPTRGRAEILLLREEGEWTWEAMVGGSGLNPGVRLQLEGNLTAEILEDLGGPRRLVRFDGPLEGFLQEHGQMPLPPYIKKPLRHPSEYQTVFAARPGSAAAPTAGLHFTPALLRDIETAGVRIVRVTLHVGVDTFAPVHAADPRRHPIHSEWCRLDPSAAEVLNRARSDNRRIIAVGTTSVRTLETAVRATGGRTFGPWDGPTDLFILPGFEFRAVDALLTNFHLPRSTLLMLVCAFAGRESILHAYQVAQEQDYRFYSFGDAMFIS